MFRQSFLVLILAISCFSCKRPPAQGMTTNTNATKVDLGAYPFAVGRMWVYDSGDTLRVVADTVIDGMSAFKVVKSNSTYTNVIYCANKPDGLYILGSNASISFKGLITPAYNTYDTVRMLSTPVQLTQLPAVLTRKWNAHVPEISYLDREWVSYASVTTPAGTFNSIKLTTNWFDEYYSAEKGILMMVEHVECFASPCPDVVTKLVYTNF